ncbi:hybrid sensor histidine kinase/response regulator, partial [Blautia pseudococcoides]|nr:hybrid sensor histidine kinase/response regulator [Blautia pseudococcoides]
MIQNKEASGIKKKTALAAVLVGIVLFLLTFLFVQGVKKQLWEQSINTIMESTRQGCNTLKVQLGKNYESMDTIAGYMEQYTREQEQELADVMEDYSNLESGMQLYLSDGTCIPEQSEKDEAVEKALQDKKQDSGILDTHISSVTGINVFELFVRVKLQDATGYLIKQYEVESIVNSFSLSFYNDAGFSYVVNTQGDVLIRSPHPNSNKTVQNLFDMLPAAKNEEAGITEFRQSLEDLRTGWAVFYYQEEDTVFCYTPLKLDTDWYLISIIPKQVVDAQTNVILLRSLALIASILVGIFLLFAFYLHYVNKTNKRLRSQANYIGHLYNAIPEGVALITVEQPYHLLQLNREGLRLLSYPDSASN